MSSGMGLVHMAISMNRFLRSLGLCLFVAMLGNSAPGLDPHKSATQFAHTAWTARDGITGPVRAIAQTPDGYLWLGTDAGLYQFDGLRFVLWQPAFGEQLLSSAVLSLCAARDGSLWIGSASGGISQLRHGRLKNYSSEEGAPNGGIQSIVEDGSGVIWAGGTYGFGKFENGQWRRVGEDLGYRAPGIQTLLVDHRGNLWVATDGLNFGLSKDSVWRNTMLTVAPNAKRFAGTGEAVGAVWNMAEARAKRIGGQFRVLNRASAGTEVELGVPSRVAFESQASGGAAECFFRLYPGKRKKHKSQAESERSHE
jgi:ligand-binding sensor domain-containing protein